MKLQLVKDFPYNSKDIESKIPCNNNKGKTGHFWSIYKLKYFTFSDLLEIDIDDLKTNYPVSQSKVTMYENLIKRGEKLPPILVGKSGQILDGMYRVIALKNLNKETVRAYVCDIKFFPVNKTSDIPF